MLRKDAKTGKELKKVIKKPSEIALPSGGGRTELQVALKKKKITKKIIAVLNEGLTATHPPKYSKDGNVLVEETADHAVRHKFADLIVRVRGDIAPEKREEEHRVIVLNLTPALIKGLQDSKAITATEVKELKELKHTPIRD